MKLEFIDIVSTGKDARVSCFQVTNQGFKVVGNLPHGYEFKPQTAKDSEKFQAVLAALERERLEE